MPRPSSTPPSRPRILALALAATLAAGALWAESGTVLKDTPLRSQPLGSADVVAQLRARETVTITQRQGAWAGVTTGAGTQGWARILNLRTGAGQAGGSGGALASAFLTGSSGTTVSTGVKGLTAASLTAASPDEAELARLDGYAISGDEAQAFAGEVPLDSEGQPYLKAPRAGRRDR
jgi:hypothetical protein